MFITVLESKTGHDRALAADRADPGAQLDVPQSSALLSLWAQVSFICHPKL